MSVIEHLWEEGDDDKYDNMMVLSAADNIDDYSCDITNNNRVHDRKFSNKSSSM